MQAVYFHSAHTNSSTRHKGSSVEQVQIVDFKLYNLFFKQHAHFFSKFAIQHNKANENH